METQNLTPIAAMDGGFPNWDGIFPRARVGGSFEATAEFTGRERTLVRELFVDLGVVAAQLAKSKKADAPLSIHADVLRISAPVVLTVSELRIHTRRLEVAAGAGLVLNPAAEAGKRCEAEIIQGELVCAGQELFAVNLLGFESAFTPAEMPRRLRLQYGPEASGEYAANCECSDDVIPGDPLAAAQQLLAARCLRYVDVPSGVDRTRLAVEMTGWVQRCQAREDGDARLAAESTFFLEHLQWARRGLWFVPFLRRESYLEEAKAVASALMAAEDQADRYLRGHRDATDRIRTVDVLRQHCAQARTRADRMRDQAAEELAAASAALEASQKKLVDQQTAMSAAETRFSAGIESKHRELIATSVLGGIVGAIAVIAGVAALFAGNPAGVGGAAGGAEAAAAAGAKLSKLAALCEKLKRAFAAAKAVADVAKACKEVVEFGSKHLKDWGRYQELQGWWNRPETDATMTDADWDSFEAEIEGTFAEVRPLQVDGAETYLAELHKFAIRSKDVLNTQLECGRCQRLHLERLWDCEVAEADFAEIGDLVETLRRENEAACDIQLNRCFERLATNLKLQLIQAIENHADAFRYYALREPTPPALFSVSAANLQETLAQAMADVDQAKASFPAEPGSFKKTYRVWSHSALDQLRRERRLSWKISMNHFEGCDRVRFEEVRVWLEGADLGTDEITILISSSGLYRDRLAGRKYEFATRALARRFSYRRVKDSVVKDHLDQPVDLSAQANDAEHDYFQPTPFTTWAIAIPAKANPNLRLERMTGIGLQFFGTYINGSGPDGIATAAIDPGRGMSSPPHELTCV